MDLRQLEVLRAIGETGSFTGAGRRLHVSQSAVSRQVLLLEEQLGEPLFLRVGRRVRFTPAGEAIVKLADRVFQDIHETTARLTDTRQTYVGPIRIFGGMTVSLYVFPALLRDLTRRLPGADVKLEAGSSDRGAALIREGSVDVGLLTLPIDEPDLVVRPALEEELLIVSAPSHPLARRRRVPPHDLRGQPFVLFERGSNTRRLVDALFARHDVVPRVVMETENVEILKALVRAGLGITIIPYQAVAREVGQGQFVCARVQGEHLTRRTGWVHARSSRVPRAVHEVLAAFERIAPRLRLTPPKTLPSPRSRR